MERIKGVRQKTGSGQYSSFVPFGTDGEFVEMISELNLEYELKLGTKHLAQIDEDEENKTTTIIENYATPTESSASNSSFYRVSTKISVPNPEHSRTTRPDDEGVQKTAIITDNIQSQLYWVTRVNGVETQKFIIGKETLILEVTLVDPVPGTDTEPGIPGVYRTLVEETYFNSERTGEEEG